jgi:hypothetical protein
MLVFVGILSLLGQFAPNFPDKAPVLVSANQHQRMNLSAQVFLLPDQSENLDIETISRPEMQRTFIPNAQVSVNRGFSESVTWMRLTLKNRDAADARFVLELNNPRLYDVTFCVTHQNEMQSYVRGQRYPESATRRLYPQPSIPILLSGYEEKTIFVRLFHSGSLRFRVFLWNSQAFALHRAWWFAFQAILIGALLVMALYNLCVFVSLREITYLLLTLLILVFVLYQLARSGLGALYIWPQYDWFTQRCVTFSGSAATALGVLFANAYMETARYSRFWHRVLVSCAIAMAAAMVLALTPWPWKYLYANAVGLLTTIALLSAIVFTWRLGNRPALHYLFAWGLTLAGSLLLSLTGPGLLPTMWLTEYGVDIAFVFSIVLWSFALTGRVKQRQEADRKLLEAEVSARTRELTEALEAVKQLRGLLPICSHCKNIRNDHGYWSSVEQFLQEHTDAMFTHGLCPKCAHELYPDIFASAQDPRLYRGAYSKPPET